MKITFFIGSLSGGGAERVVCNLSNFLIEKGHDISVLTVGKADNRYYIDERVKVSSLETEKRIKFYPLRVLVKMARLKKRLKNDGVDLFVALLPETISALMRLKRLIKSPVIVCERNSPEFYGKSTVKDMLKRFKAAEGAVFQTEEIKNFYSEKISLKSFKVIPNAVNPEFILPPFNGERRKTVISVGRHNAQKNFDLLISAFAEVSKDFPEYTLEIYGKGELTQEYKAQCGKLGITDKVMFCGFCDNVKEKLYGADLFVISSDYEGVPNALIEAMALSTPCVSTDFSGGGARALIENGKNGLLVKMGDKAGLVAAMKRVLSDRVFAEKLAVNANKITEKLSPEKIYGEWEEYFRSVIRASGNEI